LRRGKIVSEKRPGTFPSGKGCSGHSHQNAARKALGGAHKGTISYALFKDRFPAFEHLHKPLREREITVRRRSARFSSAWGNTRWDGKKDSAVLFVKHKKAAGRKKGGNGGPLHTVGRLGTEEVLHRRSEPSSPFLGGEMRGIERGKRRCKLRYLAVPP